MEDASVIIFAFLFSLSFKLLQKYFIFNKVCGKTSNPSNVKIVGGVEANDHSWPAEVYIYMNFKGTYQIDDKNVTIIQSSSCGGTLIDEFTVLTAAHCMGSSFTYDSGNGVYLATVDPLDFTQYAVFVGAHDISSVDYSGGCY